MNTTQRYQFGLNALVIEVYLPLSVCLGLHLPFLCLASVIFLTLESYFECLFSYRTLHVEAYVGKFVRELVEDSRKRHSAPGISGIVCPFAHDDIRSITYQET